MCVKDLFQQKVHCHQRHFCALWQTSSKCGTTDTFCDALSAILDEESKSLILEEYTVITVQSKMKIGG